MLSSCALNFATMEKNGREFLELESSENDFHCIQESDEDFNSRNDKHSQNHDNVKEEANGDKTCIRLFCRIMSIRRLITIHLGFLQSGIIQAYKKLR